MEVVADKLQEIYRSGTTLSIPCHTIPHHTIPYHTMPHHTTPYHTIPYHTIPYHAMPCHAMPCHAIPYHTIPYRTVPYHRHHAQHLARARNRGAAEAAASVASVTSAPRLPGARGASQQRARPYAIYAAMLCDATVAACRERRAGLRVGCAPLRVSSMRGASTGRAVTTIQTYL